MISEANMGDREGLDWLLNNISMKQALPKVVWADQAYSGVSAMERADTLEVKLEIVSRRIGICKDTLQPKSMPGFHVVQKRWIVERTFAWFGKFRRLSKDYELTTSTSKTMISWQ